MAHAKLSPSAYARWMNCPGSVQFIEYLEENNKVVYTTSYAAEEGTAAHTLGEECLKHGTDPRAYLGEKIYGDFKVTEEMCEAVEVYVDFVNALLMRANENFIDADLKIEVKCSLRSYRIPGLDGGTSDTVIIYEDGHGIEIVDYKHGKGVPVEVEDNGQLMQYALGVVLKFVKEHPVPVTLTIVQPRAPHPDGPIRSIQLDSQELVTWGEEVLVPAAKATLEPDAELIPGDKQCRWCPAKGQCTALYEKTQEIAIADFSDDNFPDPRVMTDEQLMVVMDHSEMIRTFINEVEIESKNRFDAGDGAFRDRYKLVKSRTNRKLKADAADDLSFYLEDEDLYNHKLKGLGDIERALKREYSKPEVIKIMEEVTTKEEGQTVIAPITDKRRAIEPSITTDFDDL